MKIAAFSKTYGQKTILDFPGLELTRGRVTAVVGANGSGKSTLCRVLAGVEPADQRTRPLTGIRIGYLPQKSYGFRLSVRANLLLNGQDEALAARRMAALKLDPLAKARGDRLSGGETARMALARLLMGTYDLVVLDEPTAAMDQESTLMAEALIGDYVQETGCALLLVTHSLQQARRMAHEAVFLHEGRLVERGPASELLYRPAQPETIRFLEFYGFCPSAPIQNQ